MKTGVVMKAFPFAFDGINVSHLAVTSKFPPEGFVVADNTFDGLVDAGYIKADEAKAASLPEEEALNRSIIESVDRRLAAASDQELKEIIARSGTPYSGNMVHAHLVFAAKSQLKAEMDGAKPVFGIDPNGGVTEQPRAKPGEATPPSAAAAVEQQHDQKEAAQKAAAEGENKATNQFGEPLSGGGTAGGEVKLDDMTIAELKDLAESRTIDLGEASKKADIIKAIETAQKS